MYKFEIILYWSNEDHAFVAEAPELPGCMAHGDSQETALKRINEAMQLLDRYGARVWRSDTATEGERLMFA